jgi:hypothetical protein
MANAVGGLLVFAHPRCRLEVAASRVPIARPGRAREILRGCHAQPRLSEAKQARLVDLVVTAQPPAGIPAWVCGGHWAGPGATGCWMGPRQKRTVSSTTTRTRTPRQLHALFGPYTG